MSLPKPYYEDEARGIVIYNADDRVYWTHEARPEARLQAVSRTHCKKDQAGAGPSSMEGRQCFNQVWSVSRSTSLQRLSTLLTLWWAEIGTSPRERQHCGQRAREYPMALPSVSHEKGWAV